MTFASQNNLRPCRASLFQAICFLSSCLAVAGCAGASGNSSVSSSPTPTPTPTPVASSSCSVPAVSITHSSNTTNAPQVVFLDPSVYPKAICNDGSAAAYILRPGSGSAASRFVISLQGGSDCYDQPSCSTRAMDSPQLISSNSYINAPASSLQLAGLQGSSASTNPDFYDATQVLALYCSSDRWSGTQPATGSFQADNDATWSFQGRAIISAVVQDLAKNHGLSSATEVLLTGGSAGGVGVYVNVNAIVPLIPSSARFVASSDAGFDDLANDFNAAGTPPDYDTTANTNQIEKSTAGMALWNSEGDSVCAASATTSTEQLQCSEASQLLAPGGTITLPMLVMEAQQDTNQLNRAGVPGPDISSGNFTVPEAGYVSYFASTMRTELAATNANVSVFSPDALLHEEQNDPTLFDAPVSFPGGTLTLQQAVHNWYQEPCTPMRNIAN